MNKLFFVYGIAVAIMVFSFFSMEDKYMTPTELTIEQKVDILYKNYLMGDTLKLPDDVLLKAKESNLTVEKVIEQCLKK